VALAWVVACLASVVKRRSAAAAFGPQRGSIAAFVVHTSNVLLSLICTVALMRRGTVVVAWSSIVAVCRSSRSCSKS
jgi:hypothetical protein